MSGYRCVSDDLVRDVKDNPAAELLVFGKCKVNMECEGKWYTFKIEEDKTVRKKRYISIIKNPYRTEWESKVIYGGSLDVIQNKIRQKMKEWHKKSEEGVYVRESKRRAEYQKALQQAREADSLPFN